MKTEIVSRNREVGEIEGSRNRDFTVADSGLRPSSTTVLAIEISSLQSNNSRSPVI